jgi:hypothetical protein
MLFGGTDPVQIKKAAAMVPQKYCDLLAAALRSFICASIGELHDTAPPRYCLSDIQPDNSAEGLGG